MTTTAHDIGETRRFQATFKDLAGDNTDPSTATIIVREPDGVETTESGTVATPANLTNSATGVWHYDFALTKTGRHIVRWSGTGNVATAERDEFWVRQKGTS